ncbi:class I SAM-dependent methyltransferase [Citricoccus nitrophenolicus]|uniref:class I SAM-dependent methyltransferase n=1 Tax=Citricoccus nitrophenolicus TaxID=863575 RepID=UPI0039B41DA8
MSAHHESAGTHGFDRAYWEDHWAADGPQRPDAGRRLPVSPYLPAETGHLPPGSALDAGCGQGTEALWLADRGWQVTGADLSATALAEAARRAEAAGLEQRVQWVETDLTRWEPDRSWDLVATHYAHPESGQLTFYDRLGELVAPGGTLLIVGHRHGEQGHGEQGHPEGATATLAGITGRFAGPGWSVEAAYENERTIPHGGRDLSLRDVVVRVRRNLP